MDALLARAARAGRANQRLLIWSACWLASFGFQLMYGPRDGVADSITGYLAGFFAGLSFVFVSRRTEFGS